MRVLASLALLTALLSAAAAGAAPTWTLPPGEIALSDLGDYQVGYQSYGAEPVLMPPSYVGHFLDPSGISYLPGQRANERPALLLHSPWRVPPGKTWVDYPLRLPSVKPITFSFGIAIGREFAVPGRSDGVTFSAYLVAGGETKELMREHQATADWHDFTFDFSAYAGQEIALRLQVEPGPQNNPSWDYSYFGNPRLVIGEGSAGRQALLTRLLQSKAYLTTKDLSLKALANPGKAGGGVAPGNLLPGAKVTATRDGQRWQFLYDGKDARVLYTYEPRTGTLADLTVQVDDTPVFQPAAGGGLTAVVKADGKEQSVTLTSGKLLKATATPGGGTVFSWQYDVGGQPVVVDWTLALANKSLLVSVRSDNPVISRCSLGRVGAVPLRRPLTIPYLPPVWGAGGQVEYLPVQNVFVSRYLDWTQSGSSTCPAGEATYEPKTDGARNPLRESGYIAVSPNLNEVLPNIPHPPSPYLKLLGDKIMLDIWRHHNGTYQGDAASLRELKDNGVDHVAIIQHVWQRYGYDVKLPDHIPANPSMGGDAGMIEFGKAANACRYVWSVHENYIDLYPDAPSYDPTARVLTASGEPSKAWFNSGTGVQSFGLKCNRALGYAQQNAPYIHKTYGTSAAYLDVHTCVPPWHQLDHEASQPLAAMCQAKVKHDTELFQYMRDIHQGPLFGEGANQFYWAGRCDGVEAQVAGGEDHAPLLDLDLLKLHPQMVNHGLGYYERWFREGYQHTWGVTTGSPEQIDKYRAMELAYGHAGFVGSPQTDNVQWVAKEHHLMHAVQRLYGTAKVTDISYEVEGKFVPASLAVAMDNRWRQRIKYDSGLTVWVNWAAAPWTVGRYRLPQWGLLAQGPGTEVYTALQGDKFADYAECPEYVFADARTSFDMPYRKATLDVEPRLKEFKYLGDDRISVTYEWVVKEAVPGQYNCFVHFLNEGKDNSEKIVFQNDHRLPAPTDQWQPGQTLVDGPHEVKVSPDFDTYRVAIGLFKEQRLRLKGLDGGGSKIIIGELQVTRENGKITDVKLGDLAKLVAEQKAQEADFSAHMNPPGTLVDFGKLATDGSVKVNRDQHGLTVFPYPRDAVFQVRLNLPALAPREKIVAARLKVRAQAALTRADMGPVPFTFRNGLLAFKAGKAGAGRFVVSW